MVQQRGTGDRQCWAKTAGMPDGDSNGKVIDEVMETVVCGP